MISVNTVIFQKKNSNAIKSLIQSTFTIMYQHIHLAISALLRNITAIFLVLQFFHNKSPALQALKFKYLESHKLATYSPSSQLKCNIYFSSPEV